jgi:hypothetical protein
MIVIDLPNEAVVGALFNAGSQTNANGSAVDLNNGDVSTNLVLNAGAVGSDGVTVKAQESDDQATWSDISGGSFTLNSTGGNSVQTKRVLRAKRYARGVTSGVTAATNFSLLVVAQKQYVYDSTNDNTGVDKSPST